MITLFLLLGQGLDCYGQLQTIKIDSNNTKITFNVKHLGVLNVEGIFKEFKGHIILKDKKIEEIDGEIKVASISTNDKSRDEVLLSDSYFNIKGYEFMRFKSESIDEKSNTLSGQLIIKNIANTIEFSYMVVNKKLKLTSQIDRKDFELNFGAMDALIANEINIDIETTLTKD